MSKNVSFNRKDNKKNRGHKESRAKLERKTLNVGHFSQYVDNCSQVWFRMGLDDSNFLWKNCETLFSLFFKQKNVSNYFKWNELLFKYTLKFLVLYKNLTKQIVKWIWVTSRLTALETRVLMHPHPPHILHSKKKRSHR